MSIYIIKRCLIGSGPQEKLTIELMRTSFFVAGFNKKATFTDSSVGCLGADIQAVGYHGFLSGSYESNEDDSCARPWPAQIARPTA
jgi:hypothetical protein